jgi:hypothetical protein
VPVDLAHDVKVRWLEGLGVQHLWCGQLHGHNGSCEALDLDSSGFGTTSHSEVIGLDAADVFDCEALFDVMLYSVRDRVSLDGRADSWVVLVSRGRGRSGLVTWRSDRDRCMGHGCEFAEKDNPADGYLTR